MVNLCQLTVGIYVNKYKENGINCLAFCHSLGAPRRLTSEQESRLLEVITTHTPDEVGFSNWKNWYVDIIRQWIQDNFGVKYSYTGNDRFTASAQLELYQAHIYCQSC